MNSHAELLDMVTLYDTLTVAQRTTVDEHVRSCAECAARLASYRRMDQALRRLEDPWPSRRVAEGVAAILADEPLPARTAARTTISERTPRFNLPGVLVPAGVILILLASVWLGLGAPGWQQLLPSMLGRPQAAVELNDRITLLLLGTDINLKTDTVMVLTLDPRTQSAGILSLPRDLKVRPPAFDIDMKLNMVYAAGEAGSYPGGGSALVRNTAAALIGHPIDYTLNVDFTGFKALIDAIGGVDIDVPTEIYDAAYPDDRNGYLPPVHFKAGRQHMDGEAVLKYARTRHADNDFMRAARQQQIVMAIQDKMSKPGQMAALLTRLPHLLTTLAGSVQTDLPIDNMTAIARQVERIDGDKVTRFVIDTQMGTVIPNDPNLGYVLVPDVDKVRAIAATIFTDAVRAAATQEKTPSLAADTKRPVQTRIVSIVTATPPPKKSLSTQTAAADDAFAYGVAAQVYGGVDVPSVAILAKGIGFEWVKIEVPWKQFELRKGQRGWQELDRIVSGLTQDQANLRILATIGKAPDWARPTNTDRAVDGPPADPAEYATFVAAFAARYRGKVQAIEVWDEQNLGYKWGNERIDPDRYTDLLCTAYQAIKAADPDMVVVSGGLVPTGGNIQGYDDLQYLSVMYKAGAAKCLDALGAHPTGYNNPPDAQRNYLNPKESSFKNARGFFFRETLEAYRQAMVADGSSDKRIWVTEFGWASALKPATGYAYASDNTRAEQADYIVRAYQMGKEWGWVGPMFLWNLNYGAKDPNRGEAYFDITRREAQPAYDALKQLIGSLPSPTKATGHFVWPATGNVTRGFATSHPGIDIARAVGVPVKAADAGKVVAAGWQDADEGNVIVIDHGNGWQTRYACLNKVGVKIGQQVTQGALIGEMGSTGHGADPLLHFEIIKDGVKLNPTSYLK